MTKICRNCGKVIEGSIDVCPHCGSPLKGSKVIKVDEVSPMTLAEQRRLILIGAVISLLLVTVGLAFLFSSNSLTFNLFNVQLENSKNLTNQTNLNISEAKNMTENTTEVVTEKTPTEKVVEYLNSNPIEVFGEQSSRIISVEINGETGYLTYRVTKVDPSSESTYLAGVMFLVFPNIKKVDIKGYNENGQLINASWKYPTRDKYDFSYYEIWFGNVSKTVECTTDADCNDDNNCTFDKCYSGKCSNVEIVDCPYL